MSNERMDGWMEGEGNDLRDSENFGPLYLKVSPRIVLATDIT